MVVLVTAPHGTLGLFEEKMVLGIFRHRLIVIRWGAARSGCRCIATCTYLTLHFAGKHVKLRWTDS